jgi:hypothetical protein
MPPESLKRAAPVESRGGPINYSDAELMRLGSVAYVSRCLVDDWFHARSRRPCPLHRWLMDDATTAELPARSPARPQRDARRAPAVQYVLCTPRHNHSAYSQMFVWFNSW